MKTKLLSIIGVLLFTLSGCSTRPLAASVRKRPDPVTPDPVREAYFYYITERLDLARQKTEAVLRTDPDDPAAIHLLALIREREHLRQIGRLPAWGYYQTFPQKPIYK